MVGLFSFFNNNSVSKSLIKNYISGYVTKSLNTNKIFSSENSDPETLRKALYEFDDYKAIFLDYFDKRTYNSNTVNESFVKRFISDTDKELKIKPLSDEAYSGLLQKVNRFEASEIEYTDFLRKEFQNNLLAQFNLKDRSYDPLQI
jgi:hypothetical protein